MKSHVCLLVCFLGALGSPASNGQEASPLTPEKIASQLGEWSRSLEFEKISELYHPDDLLAYQRTLLEVAEHMKGFGEPAPFAEAGITPEEAKSLSPREFLVRFMKAATSGMEEQLKKFNITLTTRITEQSDSSAKVAVRTQASLTEAQKAELGAAAVELISLPNEQVYSMKREGDRWYVLFGDDLKAYADRNRAALDAFEERAARDKGRAPAKGALTAFEVSGFRDEYGRTVIDPKFADANDFAEGRGAVEVDSKWGFVDGSGRLVIEPRFDDVGDFSDGLAAVQTAEETWGLIDTNGRLVLKPQFDELGEHSEGLIPAKKGELWGFIDKAGTVIIPFKFAEAEGFLEGKAQVTLAEDDGEEVLIDRTGIVVGKASFEERLAAALKKGLTEGLTAHKEGEAGGATTPKGDTSATPQLESFGITGYRDESGRTVIEPRFSDGMEFSEGLAAVRFFTRWGFIDATGKPAIKPGFTDARSFHSGLAAVEIDDEHWGFVDKKGRLVIKADYDDASDFSEGLAAVEKDGLWGYINPAGTLVIPARYTDAENFENGQAVVTTEDDEELVIDSKGRVIPQPKEEEGGEY